MFSRALCTTLYLHAATFSSTAGLCPTLPFSLLHSLALLLHLDIIRRRRVDILSAVSVVEPEPPVLSK